MEGHAADCLVQALRGISEVSPVEFTNGYCDQVVELGAASLTDLDAVLPYLAHRWHDGQRISRRGQCSRPSPCCLRRACDFLKACLGKRAFEIDSSSDVYVGWDDKITEALQSIACRGECQLPNEKSANTPGPDLGTG